MEGSGTTSTLSRNHSNKFISTDQSHSKTQQPTNQNADDSMLNDLSVDSNSSPHADSHAATFEPHNDVTMMSHQRKEPYSSVPQGGSYSSPSPSSTLNQTSAYSSQYPPTTPKTFPLANPSCSHGDDRPVLPLQPAPQTQLYRTVQLCQQLFHEQRGPVSQQHERAS